MLGWFAAALLVGAMPRESPGQSAPPFLLSRSFSGQFLVQSGREAFNSPLAVLLQNDTNFVRLDPTLLTISSERVKQLVWRALGVNSPWSGKIFLRLYSANSSDSPVAIDAQQFRDGWEYRVSLPSPCQRERYVRAMVSAVLLELANREAGLHSAELPAWLSEGLGREIWASNQKEVILPPPQMSDNGLRMTMLLVNARKENSLDQAHQALCASAPLTFQQLSWPVLDRNTGEPGELYRSCAQLFVHQLLALPQGQSCLRTMLQHLPRYYNWQFAFMEAFHNSFHEPLDVEKWWSLQLVHFTGRELGENWTADQSWEKLDQSVRSAVQVRIGTNELPLHAEIALQTMIRDWPPPRQTSALETKLRELQMLRPRLTHEFSAVVDDYCRVIENYLQTLNHPGFVLPFRKQVVARHNAVETLQKLDELDARRASLRPAAKPELPIQADLPITLGRQPWETARQK
jgi:hypothetical protein